MFKKRCSATLYSVSLIPVSLYSVHGYARVHTSIYIYIYQSEGFPRMGYFIPGRVGSWAWPISKIVVVRVCIQPSGEAWEEDWEGKHMILT